MIYDVDAKDLVLGDYVTYGKMTVLDRAIPDLRDGLKPVQRRVIYSMHENNMYRYDKNGKVGKSFKSARITGDTMGKYHPHGDSSIYDALINMTDDYGDLIAPYIHGDGTFGRVWSETITAAAQRYTEASLNPISREMFDGIDENAVDFVPNFDNSEKEPVVLPAKFPSILVNSTNGVAVGYSSAVPRYNLKAVCEATAKIALGQAKEPEDVVDIIGLPDFNNGGYIHASKDKALQLLKTGRAKFDLSGAVQLGKNTITITKIPCNTTIDRIGRELREASVEKIKEIKDVINSSGFNKKTKVATLGMIIELKAGSDPRRVLAKINRYTSLRNRISFITRVLDGNECEAGSPAEIGVFEVMQRWVNWRQSIIHRQYKYKYDKEVIREHQLAAWEIIKDRLVEFVEDVTKHKDDDLVAFCNQKYGLDAEQTEFLIEKKIRSISQTGLLKALESLAKCREAVKVYKNYCDNESARLRLIAEQLRGISETYGKDRASAVVDELVEAEEDDKAAEHISDEEVSIVVTSDGLVKRFMNPMDSLNYKNLLDDPDDEGRWFINCKNNETLLIFTTKGNCCKVPVHKIDNSSRMKFKDSIYFLANVDPAVDGDIAFVVDSGEDYSGYINVIYGNGRGFFIPLKLVSGNRARYINVFEGLAENGGGMITTEKRFFVLTKRNKVGYANLEVAYAMGKKAKYKIAKIDKGDYVKSMIPFDKVPQVTQNNYEVYARDYAIMLKPEYPLV